MKNLAKKLFPYLPVFVRRWLYGSYERYFAWICRFKDGPDSPTVTGESGSIPTSKTKKRILFYHVSGLSFGGSEKFLQIVAKHLNKSKYEVFFMYAPQMPSDRKSYLENSSIHFIPFSFRERMLKYPFYIEVMKPKLSEIISENNIDLIITAGSGYTEYPFNIIKSIPIVMINIFGSPSTQKNIVKHISISQEVQKKIELIVPKEKCNVMYIPAERPPNQYEIKGKELRESLGFKESDVVFGRIGRPDDAIFDSIGIEAFKRVVKKYPETKYLIQSPPPILVKKVKEEKIPNVYFLEPTSIEEKIWAFHFAIDAMAHFRLDGESCGLNIIESMIAGKPIITHRSHIWNAQLEYLEPSFSRVADKDNVEQYANFMEEFILLKNEGRLEVLGEAAKEKSKIFLIENNIKRFEKWIDKSIVK